MRIGGLGSRASILKRGGIPVASVATFEDEVFRRSPNKELIPDLGPGGRPAVN